MNVGDRGGSGRFVLSIALLAVLVGGCSFSVDDASGESSDANPSSERTASLRPALSAAESEPSGANESDPTAAHEFDGPHAAYFGGPVIERARIFALAWSNDWGSDVGFPTTLSRFYSAVTHSPYLHWLREYSTDTQRIHPARFVELLVDDEVPAATVISDAEIQAELSRFLHRHPCLSADANSIFAVHFPPGTSVTRGTRRSCFNFCGYHSSFVHDGAPLRYTVIPDLTGCAGRCGGLSALDDTFSVASHEVIETITDPDIALAAGLESPLAWYDPTYGEIADICGNQTASVLGFVVQQAWSNHAAACVSGSTPPVGELPSAMASERGWSQAAAVTP